jgi:hypothetical protein
MKISLIKLLGPSNACISLVSFTLFKLLDNCLYCLCRHSYDARTICIFHSSLTHSHYAGTNLIWNCHDFWAQTITSQLATTFTAKTMINYAQFTMFNPLYSIHSAQSIHYAQSTHYVQWIHCNICDHLNFHHLYLLTKTLCSHHSYNNTLASYLLLNSCQYWSFVYSKMQWQCCLCNQIIAISKLGHQMLIGQVESF